MKLFIRLLLAIGLTASLFAAGCASRPVAKVNGTPISQENFTKGLEHGLGLSEEFQAGRVVLDTLIGIRLIEKEAAQKNITVSEEELSKALEDYKKSIQASTNVPFDEFLKKTGATLEDIKTRARLSVLLKKLVVSDLEVEEYFKAHVNDLNKPERVTFLEVFLPTQEDAAALSKQIVDNKGNFVAAAQAWEKSGKRIATPPDGVQRTLPVDRLSGPDADIKTALLALQPGTISKPQRISISVPTEAKGGQGKLEVWSLLQLISHDKAETATLENSRDAIRQQLYLTKNYSGEVAQYVSGLKARARIEILDPTYSSLSADYKKLAEVMPKPNIPAPEADGHEHETAPAPPGTTAP